MGSAAWAQQPGDYLRLTIEGKAVPYQSVVYTFEATQGVVSARVTYQRKRPRGHVTRLTLLPFAEWNGFVTRMRAQRFFHRKSKAGAGRINYKFEFRLGSDTGGWGISETALLEVPKVFQTFQAFRDAIRQVTPPVTFWDGDLPEDKSGRLRISSLPRAWVFIDDVPLQALTPIPGIRMMTGRHEIRLVDPKTKAEWLYPILIRRGVTTQLDVELK